MMMSEFAVTQNTDETKAFTFIMFHQNNHTGIKAVLKLQKTQTSATLSQ